MLLAIDVGNTNIVVGVCVAGRLARTFRVTSPQSWTADDAGLLIRNLLMQAGLRTDQLARVSGGAVLCSVVPSLTAPLEDCLRDLFGEAPVVVSAHSTLGLEILYRDPYSVGGDRLADAIAVLRHYRTPAIVVDLGTATTFDVIDDGGRYLGGVIAPGVMTAAADLVRRAARLAAVELVIPSEVVGRSTEESLQSGIIYGAAGQVDGIVRRIISERRFEPIVIATGGLAQLVAQVSETVHIVDEALTLKGLLAVYEQTRGPASTSAPAVS
jgi:type III pantothenate kinase